MKQEKIKRFIDCHVPITTCTLRCPYCYIVQNNKFNDKIHKLKYSTETVKKALSIERLGGICLINFCAGGETLLSPQVLDYIKAILEEGHFVSVVTNATLSKRFDDISKWDPTLLERLFFKFSYHYEELKRLKMLDKFFDNIRKVRDAGASFTLEITPYDELLPLVDELNQRALEEVGAIPHYTIARDERDPEKLPILTKMSKEEYYKTWGKNKSSFFQFKSEIFEVKRKEFCYAGDWTLYLDLGTGEMRQCYKTLKKHNIFEHPEEPIPFCAIGNNCCEHHCFNGHVWLSLGDIPELNTPTYGEIRNKICVDGSEWLKPRMKAFLNTKLKESNEEYSEAKKKKVNREAKLLLLKPKMIALAKAIIHRMK